MFPIVVEPKSCIRGDEPDRIATSSGTKPFMGFLGHPQIFFFFFNITIYVILILVIFGL